MGDRNNFGKYEFFSEKWLQNRLWALWRPRKGPKTRKMFYQPQGHMSRSKAEMIYDMN